MSECMFWDSWASIFFMYSNGYTKSMKDSRNYLILGTGNACAWHKRAKLVFTTLSKSLRFKSEEKVGAFAPTGSKKIFKIKKKMIEQNYYQIT